MNYYRRWNVMYYIFIRTIILCAIHWLAKWNGNQVMNSMKTNGKMLTLRIFQSYSIVGIHIFRWFHPYVHRINVNWRFLAHELGHESIAMEKSLHKFCFTNRSIINKHLNATHIATVRNAMSDAFNKWHLSMELTSSLF